MASSKILTPEVLWAQRSSESDPEENYLLITIAVPDCEEPSVKLDAKSLDFSAKSKGHVGDEHTHQYKLNIKFFKEIAPEKTLKKIANGQHYFLKVFKKDLGIEYWPRLTEEKVKYSYIKTDFNKWVDEDEQNLAPPPGGDEFSDMMGNGNPGMMGGSPDMEMLKQQMAQAGGAGGLPDFGAGGLPDMEMLKQQLAQSGGRLPDFGAAGLGEELDEDEGEDEEQPEEK